jgi:hypothetical protein
MPAGDGEGGRRHARETEPSREHGELAGDDPTERGANDLRRQQPREARPCGAAPQCGLTEAA